MISGKTMDEERALYHLCDETVEHCVFEGPADGESALKESRNVKVDDCDFRLRYPLWHASGFSMQHCRMTEQARAAIWYAENSSVADSRLHGVKCLRECADMRLSGCDIVSPEFGWQCRNVELTDSGLVSEYVFLHSTGLRLDRVRFRGKYSFQYTKDVVVENSELDTKDAFWHAENVTVRNCTVKGEYLGWYSDGLTLIDCTIIGTQPLCYCKNLKLINCRMENTDLAFEYSDVQADIRGTVLSVKNPLAGEIVADGFGEIIREAAVYDCRGTVRVREAR